MPDITTDITTDTSTDIAAASMRGGRVWAVIVAGAVAVAATGCARTAGPDGDATVNAPPPPASGAGPAVRPASGPVAPAAASLRPEGVERPSAGAVVELQELVQPAIWPASGVVFATPEEAARDFVAQVLIGDGEPVLGEFQAGDARSGEIAVLFAGETGDADPAFERGTVLLRQLGPDDGWFVIAAVSDGATIETPSSGAEVAPGPLAVSGQGRGFEGTLVVSAFAPGDASAVFDREIGAGGAMAELAPYSVELDLTGRAPGETVVILVHGDTGVGSDPSTFAALPVVVAAVIPATR